MRSWFVLLILTLLFALVLTGCEGSGAAHHDVVTDAHGSLYGMTISPDPQTLGIPVSTDFLVSWQHDTYPPNSFQVSLYSVDTDNHLEEIYTDFTELGPGSYKLAPTHNLPDKSFLLLTISGGGETQDSIFLTDSTNNAPAKLSVGPGQATHVVKTR